MDLETAKKNFHKQVRKIQDDITGHLKRIDSDLEMVQDDWEREDFVGKPGGGGITRAFSGGKYFENAGVNTSIVFGKIDPAFGAKLRGNSDQMWATGVSVIIHPKNPKIPTIHCNYRMIESGDKAWFGGGADLTPFYPHTEDFKYFHEICKEACQTEDRYREFKDTCDKYFVNHHRGGEMRGIGGIFYDHFFSGNLEEDLKLVTNISEHFCKSYFPIVEKRLNESFTESEEDFMLHRRGRYVEFNLLHDRGTMFGLKTKGRVDSILISLPARCKFTYKYAPIKGSPMERMQDYYFPKDWV